MTSKMISIREDVYKDLKNLKGPKESFSDLIERLIKSQKKNPLKHFGIAKDMPKKVLDDFEKTIIDAKKEDAIKSNKKFQELWGNKE
ncbi:MAG: antitoxin [Promethearchaeota archaeon]|nr:MAG: antitoxin [Candidatus Lokiarchaeota archaeon]